MADGLVELGGPDVVDWNGLWGAIKSALGTRRPALHVPAALIRPAALFLEHLPNPPVTRDQLTMLRLGDNVVSDGGAGMAALGLDDLRAARRAAAPRGCLRLTALDGAGKGEGPPCGGPPIPVASDEVVEALPA